MSKARIDADLVYAACYRYLRNREKKIQARREAMIQERMKQRRFLAFLIGRAPYPTYEEAKAELESAGSFHEYNMIEITGGWWASQVEQLKDLAAVASKQRDGSVMVSQDLASVLRDYFDSLLDKEAA